MKGNFQTILLAVFMAFFVFGVLVFSGLLPIKGAKKEQAISGSVVAWGTFDNQEISKVFENITSDNKNSTVTYVKKDKASYEEELIEAFAGGGGPDVFFVEPSMINKFNKFVYKIPYTSFPEKSFNESFIDGARIYLSKDGIIGLPVVVDPLVLYYSRDALANDGIPSPIVYWDELLNLSGILTKKDKNAFISQSMIAFGQYSNVNNAKEIIATLLLQIGNELTKRTGDSYVSVFNGNESPNGNLTDKVFEFFIEFSNPSSTAYSWNRSFSGSLDMFTSGKLVFYPGFSSELFKIRQINPNLGFDITGIPQARGLSAKRTFGNIYAVSINSKSKNINGALGLLTSLSIGERSKEFSMAVSLPPTSKKLLADRPSDPYLDTFYRQALISYSWVSPESDISNQIFSELIENILSGKFNIREAIGRANDQINSNFKK